ncbi:MAG TPA: hypothetical protein VEW46_16805, partial [Pyrinomonadaceae bacterium]|nr:hypothetical protein [Pyrinomonadaceae bacterium]
YRNVALATFLVLLVASSVLLGYGRKWLNDAKVANGLAQEAERTAAERIKTAQARVTEAEAKIEEANGLAVAADKKRQDAEAATAKANDATKAAEEKRTVAERKTQEAEALRQTAEAEARKQQGVAASREKASESTQLIRGGVGRIREAIKTAEESVKLAADVGAATTESYMAMRSSLAMLPALRVRRPLDGAVNTAFSPDGRTVAVAGPEQTLRLFKADDLQARDSAQLKPLTVKGENIFAVSDGGKFLALADSNHVRIFDSETMLCEFQVKNQNLVDNPGSSQGEDAISGIALSPDGKYIAVAANHKTADEIEAPDETRDYQGVVTLWYVDRELKKATRIAILGDDFNRLLDIAFGPNGDVLAAGGKRGAILWDLENVRTRQQQRKRLKLENILKADGMEGLLTETKPQQSPNEYEGATSIDFDLIRVFVAQDHDVTKVAPGNAVSRFASAAGDNVTIWQRAPIGGYEPSAYLPLSRNVRKLALDYDGETLSIVNAGQTGKGVVYEVWDTNGYSNSSSVDSKGKFLSLWFTDQNALFAEKYTDFDEDVRTFSLIWPSRKADDDSKTLRLQAYSAEWGTSLGQGKYVLAGDEEGKHYYTYPIADQQKKFPLPASFADEDNLFGTKIGSDDAGVVLALPGTAYGEVVNVFTLEGDKYVQRESIKDLFNRTYFCLSMKHDGSVIAYKNLEGKVILRNPRGNSRVFVTLEDQDSLSCMEFSPKGTYLVFFSTVKQGDADKHSAIIYRTADGVRMGEIPRNGVNDQTFSADERFIATAGDNGVVQVLEIKNWKVQSYSHSNPVYKVVLDPQGEFLATISTERDACSLTRNEAPESIVTIFDRKGGSESARLFQKGCVKWLSFSPDGTHLATAAELETPGEPLHRVTVWNVGVDDLVREAESRLKCMTGTGGAANECGGDN